MLGQKDTLPGAGGPQWPHVLPFVLLLERASGQAILLGKCDFFDENRPQVGQGQSRTDPPGPQKTQGGSVEPKSGQGHRRQ